MENLTLGDQSQASISPHLQDTERMLARAASLVSGSEQPAKVWAMPDLSFSTDVKRFLGGFFCGAFYSWESSEPFVPIDANLNCCGVSMFKLKQPVEDYAHFADGIRHAMNITRERSSYLWNFGAGNHFVIFGYAEGSQGIPEGPYGLLHSSAGEFKKQHNGLYPTTGNWFGDRIETIEDPSINRHIRFIRGKFAERFIQTAKSLDAYNQQRHRYFADLIFGVDNIDDEVCNLQHYGMPTENSIAIGCQWMRERVVPLLTAPEKPVYLVHPKLGGINDVQIGGERLTLFPHGLGRCSRDPMSVEYVPSGIVVNGAVYTPQDSLRNDERLPMRDFDRNEAEGGRIPSIIRQMLERCAADIVAKIDQIYSYHSQNPIPD